MITQRAKDNIIYRLRDTGDIAEALAHYSYDEADVADALLGDVDFAAKVRCNLNPVNDAYFANLYDTCDVRTAAEATAGMTLLELLARETSTRFSAREASKGWAEIVEILDDSKDYSLEMYYADMAEAIQGKVLDLVGSEVEKVMATEKGQRMF